MLLVSHHTYISRYSIWVLNSGWGYNERDGCHDSSLGPTFQKINTYTVKKNYEFPGFFLTKPSRDMNLVNYSRPGRVWLVTSRLGTGNRQTFFYSVGVTSKGANDTNLHAPKYFRYLIVFLMSVVSSLSL